MIATTRTMERTDEDLVAALAVAGEQEAAAEALLARYWGRAYPVALRLVGGDPGAAEDAAQEAFVQVLRAAPRFRAGARFRPWFFQILRHVASKQQRGEARRGRREEVAARADGTGDASARVDAADAVRTYLAQVSEPVREALVLHHLAGLTQREVAEALGAPLGTVSDRLRTGLERLRAAVPTAAALGVAPLEALVRAALDAPAAAAASQPVALEVVTAAASGVPMTDLPAPPTGADLVAEVAQAQRRAMLRGVLVIATAALIAGGLAGRVVRWVQGAPEAALATRWAPAGAPLSVPIPAGWSPYVVQGQAALVRDASIPSGFGDNVVLTRQPRPAGKTLAAYAEEHRVALAQAPFVLHSVETAPCAGQPALWSDYERPDGERRLRHRAVLLLTDDEVLVLTVTGLAERWDALAPDVDALLGGVRREGADQGALR